MEVGVVPVTLFPSVGTIGIRVGECDSLSDNCMTLMKSVVSV